MLKFSCLKSQEFFRFTRTADDALYKVDKRNRWAPFCKPNRCLRTPKFFKEKTVNLQPEKFGNPKFLSPLYQLALDQFHQSAQALDLSDNLIARMKSPDRSMMVSLPIKLDIWNSTNVLWLPGPAQQRARAG